MVNARAHHNVDCSEYFKVLSRRLYYSNCYPSFYGILILLSILGIVLISFNHGKLPSDPAYVVFEVTVCSLLTLEVIIRKCAQKEKFWEKWWNIADFAVAVFCMVSIAIHLRGESMVEELEDLAASFVLVVRNGLQYLRLVIFVRNHRNHRLQTDGNEVVDLDVFQVDEEETVHMLPFVNDTTAKTLEEEEEEVDISQDSKQLEVLTVEEIPMLVTVNEASKLVLVNEAPTVVSVDDKLLTRDDKDIKCLDLSRVDLPTQLIDVPL